MPETMKQEFEIPFARQDDLFKVCIIQMILLWVEIPKMVSDFFSIMCATSITENIFNVVCLFDRISCQGSMS